MLGLTAGNGQGASERLELLHLGPEAAFTSVLAPGVVDLDLSLFILVGTAQSSRDQQA